MLVDAMLADIVISAIAGNDIAVIIKRRLLVEYGVRGAYCNDHPDYALYIVTIDHAKKMLKRMIDSGSEPARISAATVTRDETIKRFTSVAHLSHKKFVDIMVEYGDKRDYVTQYGSPSTLLHGDPDGINAILDSTQQPRLTFEPERVNGMLVDAGRDAVFFCKQFVWRFHPNDATFMARVEELENRFLRLILSHTYGRDESEVTALRSQLGESEGTAGK
jgi:hypothetical protein